MKASSINLVSRSAAVAAVAFAIVGATTGVRSAVAAGPSPAVTKAAFIQRADAVCATYDKRLKAITPNSDPAAPGKPLVDLARIAYAWHGLEADMGRELRAIQPPQAFATRWQTAMDGLVDRVTAELLVGDDAVAKDRKALRRDGLRMLRAGAKSINALHGYGFKRCGVLD